MRPLTRLFALVSLSLVLAAPGALRSQDCIADISTGYDQDGGVALTPGEPDDDYVVDRGDGAFLDALTGDAAQGFPIPPWVANDGDSLWISPAANSSDIPGTYTYEIRFFIPDGVAAGKLSISGVWTADDGATDVIINEQSTGLTVGGFNVFSPFPVNFGIGLFTTGENVVQFVVSNGSSSPLNPTGLRVRACVVEATPQDRSFDIGTGFDDAALLVLPGGAQDDSYTIEGPPGSGIGPGPAIVVNDGGFPIPPWLASSIQSKWIGPQADSNGPAGTYLYTVKVTFLPGADAATARLLGGFASDDQVTDVLVNDVSTGIAGGGFEALTPFPQNAGLGLFLGGENAIVFIVQNGDAGATGLRVDAEVAVCPLVAPTTAPALFSLDTGFDDATLTLLPNAGEDDNYSVLGPAGSGICYPPATIIDDTAWPILPPEGPWIATTPLSKWVGVEANANGPAGVFAFETTVTLPAGYDAASARIIGRWTNDNAGLGVVVNGTPLGFGNDGNFTVFHTFPPDAGRGLFQTGDNVVQFLVENAAPGPNPVGLRVEAVVGVEDPRVDDLSTGINPRGVGALPSGALDPRYVVTGPDGSGIAPRAATVVAGAGLPGTWVPNSTESVWAGLDGGTSNGPAGTYRYRIEFIPSTSVNPARASIVGSWAAAGTGVDVLLNGTSLGLSSSGPGSFSDFPAGAGKGILVAGLNALEFIVQSAAAGSTGLRVEARIGVSEPEIDPFDISTGYDQFAATALNLGSTDDDYTVQGPSDLDPRSATVVPDAPTPPWISNAGTSGWIGIESATGEPGPYIFETFVSLTAAQAEEAVIVGAWATDDQGTDVLINDISTGLANNTGFTGYAIFPQDFGKGLFEAGSNSIRFLVTNGGTAANPVGLRVEAVVRLEASGAPEFRRGDADAADGVVNITDAIFILNYLFQGGSEPPCLDAADADNEFGINITDGIYILSYLFLGGLAPPAPGPDDCGPDPAQDPPSEPEPPLDCKSYPPGC